MSETERRLELALPGTQTHLVLGLRGQSVGNHTGMTGFVLFTDKIEETCATLKARGVTLTQELTTEPWGKWAQFTDLDQAFHDDVYETYQREGTEAAIQVKPGDVIEVYLEEQL